MIAVNRRAFAMLGGSGLVALSTQVKADTLFTQFGFQATGSPTNRTMPNRLAEIKNVKDFGAVGDGFADDTAAIQATIDWTGGPNRGVIFFPLGRYAVTAPLTFDYNGDLSIAFVGVAGTLIFGGFNDYIFKRALGMPNNTTGGRVFEKLQIQNGGATGGCIQIGSTNGAYIRDCIFSAHICLTTEDSAGNSSQNVLIEDCIFTTQGTVAGSHAAIIGGSGALMGCDCHNADTAYRVYGNGFHASGNRTELSNTAWLLGLDSGGNLVGASGFSIISGTCEGDGTAFDLAGPCSAFAIGPYNIEGHDKTNSGYPLNTNNTQYGVRVRAGMATGGIFTGVGCSSTFDVAGFSLASAASRGNNVLLSCSSSQSGGTGVGWIVPTNAYTAQFIQCNIQPVWTFSQLPTGGNVFEGDEYNISDANSTTWGANVTGSSANHHVLVRYNGSNWTVVGV